MIPDLASTCRQHLAFMQWADERMLQAVAENTPARIEVLQHIFLAELVWLGRVNGRADAMLGEMEKPADIASLQAAWPKLHGDWRQWAAGVTDWDTIVPHRNPAGVEFRMPAWQIALHLANHGSFHRGQVAAMLRAEGIAPPATDLIVYYRTLPPS